MICCLLDRPVALTYLGFNTITMFLSTTLFIYRLELFFFKWKLTVKTLHDISITLCHRCRVWGKLILNGIYNTSSIVAQKRCVWITRMWIRKWDSSFHTKFLSYQKTYLRLTFLLKCLEIDILFADLIKLNILHMWRTSEDSWCCSWALKGNVKLMRRGPDKQCNLCFFYGGIENVHIIVMYCNDYFYIRSKWTCFYTLRSMSCNLKSAKSSKFSVFSYKNSNMQHFR